MNTDASLIATIYDGWHRYQTVTIQAISPLSAEQLSVRAASYLRSVGEIAAHIIGARARWFLYQFGEGGEAFDAFCGWDRPGAPERGAAEIVAGLEATWATMHEAIARWTPEAWAQTWPGEDETEPEVITRAWVIWHLIEHDLHHGGEISITLGAHGVPALEL